MHTERRENENNNMNKRIIIITFIMMMAELYTESDTCSLGRKIAIKISVYDFSFCYNCCDDSLLLGHKLMIVFINQSEKKIHVTSFLHFSLTSIEKFIKVLFDFMTKKEKRDIKNASQEYPLHQHN
jgi:hypothetical protein